MNIVIVNHYVGGPRFGMEFRPYYLASEWQKSGHNVLLIGASFSHLRSTQPQVKERIQQENIDGVNYVWLKTNSYTGNGTGRIFSIFNFTGKLYFRLSGILKRFNPDLIIASSTYPLDNLPLRRLANKYRAGLCYEVHDLWPLSPMELGGYSKNHPFIRVMQYAEDFAYRTADFVVSILPKTLDHMISRGLNPEKFCYIPNGIVVKEWEGNQMDNVHKELLNELRKTYKTLVGYVGGHSISNALDNLLAAASLARSGEPGLAFVLIGNGADKPRLMDLAKAQHLSNVFFLDAVPKKSIPALLTDLDILYIGWHNNPLYRFGISPNKLMDYMMAGKPIVHAVNAANDFVAESGCGISVKPDDPGAVVVALRKISTWTETERRAAGARGKEFVLKNHNYEVLAQKFIDFAQGKNPGKR